MDTYKCDKCGGLVKLEIEKLVLCVAFTDLHCPYCGANQEYLYKVED